MKQENASKGPWGAIEKSIAREEAHHAAWPKEMTAYEQSRDKAGWFSAGYVAARMTEGVTTSLAAIAFSLANRLSVFYSRCPPLSLAG